jgi:hypothetical protein
MVDEQTLKNASLEIQRRRDAPATDEHAKFFAKSDAQDSTPFVMDDQVCALVSMGTPVMAPRPLDPTRPCLRVYGTFAAWEDAREHADVVRGCDPNCSLAIVKTHTWMLMPDTEEVLHDKAKAEERLRALLGRHEMKRKLSNEDFDKMVSHKESAHQADGGGADLEEEEEVEEAETLVYGKPKRLRAGAEVRGQNAVALCFVVEPQTGECAMKVLGCFESGSDADTWCQDVSTRNETEHDVVVGKTCEWLFPNAKSVKGRSVNYRHPELHKIMEGASRNKEAVKTYKEWIQEQEGDQNSLTE